MEVNKEAAGEAKVSQRAFRTAKEEDKVGMFDVVAAANIYHPINNKEGVVSFGVAESTLMKKEIQEKLKNAFKFNINDHLKYFDVTGTPKAKLAVKSLLERKFSRGNEIKEEEIFIMNGATVCFDALAYACCDPGDVIISPAPVYNRIFIDLAQRFGVDVRPLYLKPENKFELRSKDLDERIVELQRDGLTVKGFINLNPHNPLGDVYSGKLVMELLQICAKHEMHFISDEIYGQTIFGEGGDSFESVLSIRNLPDPERTHFVYGMSKDFSLPGLAFGLIHTRNKDIASLFSHWCNYQSVSGVIQDGVAGILMDEEWCNNFVKTNTSRIKSNFLALRTTFRDLEVPVHDSKAAFFAWIDLGEFMSVRSNEEEMKLFRDLLAGGVFIIPGIEMFSPVPGWFRMMYAVNPDYLSEGLNRIAKVLQSRREGRSKCHGGN